MIEQESSTITREQDQEEIEEIIISRGILRQISERIDALEEVDFLKEEYPEMFIDREGILYCIDRYWLIAQIEPNEIDQMLFSLSTGRETSTVLHSNGKDSTGKDLKPKPKTDIVRSYIPRAKRIYNTFVKIGDNDNINLSPSYIKEDFHAKDVERILKINAFLESEYPEKFETYMLSGKLSKICKDREWYLKMLSEENIHIKEKSEFVSDTDTKLIHKEIKKTVFITEPDFNELVETLRKEHPEMIAKRRSSNGKEIFVCIDKKWFEEELGRRNIQMIRSNLSGEDFRMSEDNIRRYFLSGDKDIKERRKQIRELIANYPDKFELKKNTLSLFPVRVCRDVDWFIGIMVNNFGQTLRRKYQSQFPQDSTDK